jgi:hypothetical protein
MLTEEGWKRLTTQVSGPSMDYVKGMLGTLKAEAAPLIRFRGSAVLVRHGLRHGMVPCWSWSMMRVVTIS